MRGDEDLGEVGDGAEAVFAGGRQDAGVHRMGCGAGGRLVAAAGLARDHCRTEIPLGAVVRGLDAVAGEEGEQMLPLLAQPRREARIVRIGEYAILVD